METSRQELHASGFKALLREADRTFGVEDVDRTLAELGTTRVAINDPDAWFSLELAEGFMDRLAARDPQLIARAMRHMLSPQGLGLLYPLFRTFGSALFTYRQTAKLSTRLNKVGGYVVRDIDSGHIELVYRALPDAAVERGPHMCEVRHIQLVLIPTLFDLSPADVEHPKCIARGDDACLYDVKWRDPRGRKLSRWTGAAGVLGALAVFGPPTHWSTSYLIGSAVFVAGSYAIGVALDVRRLLAARVQELGESREALIRRTEANEQRYAELLEAKSEVDKKVAQRTSELQSASQRLSETLTEIQALDRAKTDFFNNVSHELRSPLTMILAPLEDLVSGRNPPGGNQGAFESMQRNATRLLRLINQLLDLAKIDAGQAKLVLSSVNLGDLARGILVGFEPAAAKKGVRLEVAVSDDMAPMILDPAWIESAVTNLVANALRVSRSGGFVKIVIKDNGSDVALSVVDDGPGIAPEDRQKVFERFAQGDSSKRVVGGTGIGLALVREACRLHGGDATLFSELGKGATFTLTLPRRSDLRPEDLAPAPSPIPPPGVPTSSNPPAVRSSMRPGAKVIVDEFREDNVAISRPGPGPHAPLALVVEDNPELREFVADVLAARYRVESAIHGKQALALAPELRPEVIVSDVAMPEMDGYQLCRALRANEDLKDTPILLVTARTEVANVLEGFDAGANDYILKPFHGRELLARVDVHVRLRRMVQELALRERHAMLGVLSASVAHQVRNPLTTLVSGLPAMRAKLHSSLTPSTLDMIDVMMDCAGRIERLTRDLMELSRVDREATGSFRPSDGLRSAIRLVQTRLVPGVSIEEQITDSPSIDGKAGDLNHVFMNILDNAMRAIPTGGRIRIQGKTQDGAYVVHIGDSGPGISEEDAPKVFEPFYTTRQAGEGTGLGLAIALQVMRQCGGDISLGRSELGGAEFRVKIPLQQRPSTSRPSDVRAPN